jgi:hypothetical protein
MPRSGAGGADVTGVTFRARATRTGDMRLNGILLEQHISDRFVGCDRAACPRKPDSGHTDTTSITIRLRRTNWNAMKPRIQCVLTQ